MRAIRATVSGRVHGVGFRYSTQRAAAELGVAGWVRNRPDGTVEVHAQGEDDRVAALVTFLRRGPAAARVVSVDVVESTPDARYRSFEVTF